MNIASNVSTIYERIARAAEKSGRSPEEITMIAVTKTVDAETAKEVLKAGVTDLGENRVQSFLDKYEVLGDEPNWHLIGHLQTNKVKYITGKVKLIHSVDTLHLAEEISRKAKSLNLVQDILFQFNISGEESKSGAEPKDAKRIFETLSSLDGIRVRGLMTMAPLLAGEDETRRVFAGLKNLSETLQEEQYPNTTMDYLSMGMSGDFEAAILEGANLVRIGTALFK